MNLFEVARLNANDARLVLAKFGIGDSEKAYELVSKACKQWSLAILKLPKGNPLLNGADAVIRIAQKRIVVRKDLDEPLKAFLIAHELGHYFLHQGGSTTFAVDASTLLPDTDGNSAIKYVESYGPRERQELQANVFAREFLLPRILCRELFITGHKLASTIVSDLELPPEIVRLQLFDALLLPILPSVSTSPVPKTPTTDQQPAVDSPHKYTLVEAGPGTGKTTTLLLRVLKLLEAGASPTGIVILTFSNKAAGELVTRLKASGIPSAERMWVGTFHSFGLEFLRKFGTHCGLTPQIKLMDRLGGLNLLEEVLPDLTLSHFDVLSDSMNWLPKILDAITRCKDDLTDSAAYLAEIVGHPAEDADLQAKRVDTATLFKAYEDQLTAKQAVDFNDLLGLAGKVLKASEAAVEEYLHGIQHVLIDEYQDVNRASAQLVKSVAKYADTVWAVGDANQAIYAFMGASNRNLAEFEVDFPDAKRIPLGANHRSYQEITDSFYRLSLSNPSGKSAKKLRAEKGECGLGPALVVCSSEADEEYALSLRIEDLKAEVPYGEQAVLVHSNDMAVRVAKGLERHGVPVLYLGNVYERAEVKELIRLMVLSVDDAGASLGSDWTTPEFKIAYSDLLQLRLVAPELPWWSRDASGLSPTGKIALGRLKDLTAPLRSMVSPWYALCHLLLEDGWLLYRLCSDASQAGVNARLSLWQFVHSCRTPDGLNQYPTIRNFRTRILREIRLGLDKNLRNVPPEAEGLDAVRILTAHKSKGLEFEAVHLLETKREKFEPGDKSQWPLIPEQMVTRFIGQSEVDANRLQLHNLLYVAMSRARKFLTVYKQVDEQLPSAMEGICETIALNRIGYTLGNAVPVVSEFRINPISLYDLVYYSACQRRVELSHRVGWISGGSLPVHELIRIAQRRMVGGLSASTEARRTDAIIAAVEVELRNADLWEHPSRPKIAQRLIKVGTTVANLYNQGGAYNQTTTLRIGNLHVDVKANQVLDVGGQQVMRLFVKTKAQADRSRQALGVLVKTHEEATGAKVKVVNISIEDGSEVMPASSQKKTIENYKVMVDAMSKGHFEAKPSSFSCPICPYYMYCDQGQR